MKKGNNNTQDACTETFKATVVSVMNKQVQVLFDDKIVSCLLPSSLISDKNDLCVGDWVEVGNTGKAQYKLTCILPRRTAVYRGNRRFGGNNIIAANVQLLLVMVTADYLSNQAGYLEAAIIAAKRAEVKIGIYISKWDLVGENIRDLLRSKMSFYETTADFVIAESARESQAALLEKVKGKTVLVVGDRACGKTTLIKQMLRQKEQGSDNRAASSTHTSILIKDADATCWIDTPGFRDFALTEITDQERSFVFPEIAHLTLACYFRNCTHTHEDGCQVLDALRKKNIKRERYDAYQKMIQTKPTSSAQLKVNKVNYRHTACFESFACKVCGALVVPEGAGSKHRNHCPKCLSSVHVDNEPGDRASLCNGVMEPVSVWVRKGGEWAIIHRCRTCGALSSNRIAADDNPALLMGIAVKPLAMPPFPLDKLENVFSQ